MWRKLGDFRKEIIQRNESANGTRDGRQRDGANDRQRLNRTFFKIYI